jgi:hypothetical protein
MPYSSKRMITSAKCVLFSLQQRKQDPMRIITPIKQCSQPPVTVTPFSTSVSIDPDGILPKDVQAKFTTIMQKFDNVFSPHLTGYNSNAGPFEAHVNIAPVQPPQRKGRVPQYSRNQLTTLQQHFNELEAQGVFRKPEDVGISVEYLNPSFLVKRRIMEVFV